MFKLFRKNIVKKETAHCSCPALRKRRLSLEPLEERALLAVSVAEFNQIRELYPDLNLSANMGDYNVIEVGGVDPVNTTNSFAFSETGLNTAIAVASWTSENDLIVVRTNLQNKITLTGGNIPFYPTTNGSITIVSLGNQPLTISGNDRSRVFAIGQNTTVALAGLNITGGYVSSLSGGSGGAILNYGTLVVTNSTISGNSSFRDGGAIYNDNGLLTLMNCTISGNSSSSYGGGGIYNTGTVIVTNCTISGNSSYYAGGGIFNSGTAIMTHSSISGNTSRYSGDGNGISNTGELSITDCTISENKAPTSIISSSINWGGGIHNTGEVSITDSTISGNTATHGGGIYNAGALTATNTVISGNTVSSWGGGIYSNGINSTMILTNCTISGNFALKDGLGSGSGGGIFIWEGDAIVTDCTISGNSGRGAGGGVYNNGTLTLTNSTISANTITDPASYSGNGGGIYNSGTLFATNSMITGNTVSSSDSSQGGGIYNYGIMTLINSVISGNTITCNTYASYYAEGGGIYNYGTTTVTNCTISDNTGIGRSFASIPFGIGIYNENGTLNLYNSIVVENSSSRTSIYYTETFIHDIYERGWSYSGIVQGSNNLTSYTGWSNASDVNFIYDPNLPLFPRVTNVDYRLIAGSQAIDKGSNQYAYNAGMDENSLDVVGNPRFVGESIDIGAYEAPTTPLVVESPSIIVTTHDDVVDPTDGLISLREAIMYAQDGDAITFDTSLYGQTITLNGSELLIDKSITIDAADMNITIDANQRSRVFYIEEGAEVTLMELTITNGYAGDAPTNGGGIYNAGTLTVARCTITENNAFRGGGIFNNTEGALTVANCTISGNTTNITGSFGDIIDGFGGGIFSYGIYTIRNSTISGNIARSGGGIYNEVFFSTMMTLTNCTISGNIVSGMGGGICNDSGTMNITNSMISENSAWYGGGIIDGNDGTIRVRP